VRTCGFLSSILPYTDAGWEKLSIFLTFLITKLPAPEEQDLSKGILDAIDVDSYRIEKQAVQQIQLPDVDGSIGPVPESGGSRAGNRRSMSCPISSKPSTTSLAISNGPMPTGCST
jgi:type I restriction enzyme R subunit